MREMKDYKEELFKLKLSLASANKSVPWTIKDLEFVLKNLKEGKSRDPNGWVNDIFKNEAAGKYLKNLNI